MHKPEFQADAIRTLTVVTGRMQKLLAALRTSNHHQPTGSPTRASLAATVETRLRELKPQIPSRIILETRLEPTPDVAMDPEQLRTVLVNLVVNAIDAIPNEGRITVETRMHEGWAVLVVTDTGRGMSADFIRDRLFRPFQTTKPRGLGIGLFQCRHILQGFGGTLCAESHEGRGTRMIVRLPIVSSGEAIAADSASPLKLAGVHFGGEERGS
jgi:signal transduction histidine kinase